MKYLQVLTLFVLIGCSVAKISEFPKSVAEIDFDNLSKINEESSPFWTSKTSSEYYLELPKTTDSLLYKAILGSFASNGYQKNYLNLANRFFLAERGIRANEWSTLTCVYYKFNYNNTQIYVKSQITQDITGGWRENRAKKVAERIEKFFR